MYICIVVYFFAHLKMLILELLFEEHDVVAAKRFPQILWLFNQRWHYFLETVISMNYTNLCVSSFYVQGHIKSNFV